jgi:hypothetical protein
MDAAVAVSIPGAGASAPRESLDVLRRHLAREPLTAHALALQLASSAGSLSRELQEYACIAALEVRFLFLSLIFFFFFFFLLLLSFCIPPKTGPCLPHSLPPFSLTNTDGRR